MKQERAEYLTELLNHCGHPAHIEKSAVELSDILRFAPVVGGGLHGIASPARGASRGETMVYEGGGGALGGLLGLLAGTVGGHNLIQSNRIADPDGKLLSLAALLGSGLGTAVGTIPGRFLAKREVPSQDELKELRDLVDELKKRKDGSAININFSSKMPIEADKETGSE